MAQYILYMTLAAFRALHEEGQYLLWISESVHIGERETPDYCYELYQLYSFYIELRIPKWPGQRIMICSFCKAGRLEPYLQEINISGIVCGS